MLISSLLLLTKENISMDLVDLRTQFVSLSGRNDLTNVMPSGADFTKRADFFINNAVDWLDENVEIDRQTVHYSFDITAGTARMLVPDPMVIFNVYSIRSNTESHRLEERDYAWVRRIYPGVLSSASRGNPSTWTYALTDLAPNQIALTTGNFTGDYTFEFGDTLFAGESTPGSVGRYRTRSFLILPPADQTYTIAFQGKFYSKFLLADADVNYWSERRPQLLLKASLMVLEGFYRNTEGYNDWMLQVEHELVGVRKVQTDKESHDVSQMEG